jgi:hypothetical protein
MNRVLAASSQVLYRGETLEIETAPFISSASP